jgi:soluble lytic murein transglycosylase-like protein
VAQAPAVQASNPTGAEAAVAVAAGAISPIFTREVQHWAPQILAWAAAYQLDPNLVATVMQIESCGAPGVVSRSGAQGLFQVMPFHFAAGENMQDPDTNAARGMNYLALGLQRANGNAGLALAGYNGGHSQIGKDSSLWPNETQRYWYWGTGIYEEATNGAAQSGRLQEWLQAGGASLCNRAAEQIGLAAQ